MTDRFKHGLETTAAPIHSNIWHHTNIHVLLLGMMDYNMTYWAQTHVLKGIGSLKTQHLCLIKELKVEPKHLKPKHLIMMIVWQTLLFILGFGNFDNSP